MFELTVDSYFSAAHFLKGYEGDCARMHGHTWKASLTVRAESMNEIGICIDFKDIAAVLENIVERFDHRTLNELDFFRDINPTSENLASTVFDLCREKITDDGVTVLSVTIAENDRNRVTYRG